MQRVRVVLDGKISDLGTVAASEKKTFSVKVGQGMAAEAMARQYGEQFRNSVQALHNSFGNNASPITDLAAGSVAASFVHYINTGNNQGWNNFTGPATLDLSRFADSRHAILLAWDADFSPSKLDRFSAKRTHRNTLFRLVIPAKT
jgi:hypothetical protein